MLSIVWVKNATFKAVQKVTLYFHLSQGKQVKLDQDQRELRTKFSLISNGFRTPNCQLMHLIPRPARKKVSWYENNCGYMNSSIPKYLLFKTLYGDIKNDKRDNANEQLFLITRKEHFLPTFANFFCLHWSKKHSSRKEVEKHLQKVFLKWFFHIDSV